MNKDIFAALAISAIVATLVVASTLFVAAQVASAKSTRPLDNPGADKRSDRANERLAEVQCGEVRACGPPPCGIRACQ